MTKIINAIKNKKKESIMKFITKNFKTIGIIMAALILVAMAMMQGLTSAIMDPNNKQLMDTIKCCDIFKNKELYSDSFLSL